jgi:hypothetical protein
MAACAMECDSSILACDYIKFRLGQNGFDFEECPMLPEPEQVQLLIRAKAPNVEHACMGSLWQMCTELNMGPQTDFTQFFDIVDQLFCDREINWPKILLLFAYGGALAIYCFENGMRRLVCNICDWVSIYIDAKLMDWILTKGNGWLAGLYNEHLF